MFLKTLMSKYACFMSSYLLILLEMLTLCGPIICILDCVELWNLFLYVKIVFTPIHFQITLKNEDSSSEAFRCTM
jgi:hypothetical protein